MFINNLIIKEGLTRNTIVSTLAGDLLRISVEGETLNLNRLKGFKIDKISNFLERVDVELPNFKRHEFIPDEPKEWVEVILNQKQTSSLLQYLLFMCGSKIN